MQVLGTFITEHKTGQQTCEQLFADTACAEAAAEQLARIATYFGFEGWLLNIENEMDKSKIPNLIHFVRSALARRYGGVSNLLVSSMQYWKASRRNQSRHSRAVFELSSCSESHVLVFFLA